MAQAASRPDVIVAQDDERSGITAVDNLLAETLSEELPSNAYQLVMADGRMLPLPEALVRVLRDGAHLLNQDSAVAVLPVEQKLSLAHAAELLNLTLPQLAQLVARGELTAHDAPGDTRIAFGALLDYKQRRDQQEIAALDALAREADELGLYS